MSCHLYKASQSGDETGVRTVTRSAEARPVRAAEGLGRRSRLVSVHAVAPGRVTQTDLVKRRARELHAVVVRVAGAHGKHIRAVAAAVGVRGRVD